MIYQIKIPKDLYIVDYEGNQVMRPVGINEDGSAKTEKLKYSYINDYIPALLNHSKWKKDLDTIDLRRDVRDEFRAAKSPGSVVDIPHDAHEILYEIAQDTSFLPWSPEVITQMADAGFMSSILDAEKKTAIESKSKTNGTPKSSSKSLPKKGSSNKRTSKRS